MCPSSQMAEDNARDMATLRKFRAANEALRVVLEDENARRSLGAGLEGHVLRAKDICEGRAEHIEAVWN